MIRTASALGSGITTSQAAETRNGMPAGSAPALLVGESDLAREDRAFEGLPDRKGDVADAHS